MFGMHRLHLPTEQSDKGVREKQGKRAFCLFVCLFKVPSRSSDILVRTAQEKEHLKGMW